MKTTGYNRRLDFALTLQLCISCRNYERTEWSWLCFSDGVVWTHIITMRLRLFAVKRRKDGSCMSVISFNPSSSFPSFPFAWKGTIEKRERLAWCIGLHLEGSSSLRWMIRWLCLRPSWLGIAQTSLGLSTRYSVRSPFKSTVHFYRECERVMLCDWNRERLYYCISYLFPKCSHGSMVLLIFYSWGVMHYMFMMYIGVVLTKW